VAYNGLAATSDCLGFGTPPFGKLNYSTTIAYPPEALSTSQESEFFAGTRLYTAINYSQLQNPTKVTSHGPFQGSTAQVYFSLPSDLSLVDPAWKGCFPDEYGAFDPPRTLEKATALVSQDPGAQPSPNAAPASSLAPAQAPATVTSDPKDPQGDPSHKSSPALDPTQPDPNPSAKQTSVPSATPQRVEPSSGYHVGSPINSAAGAASDPPASTNMPGKGSTQGAPIAGFTIPAGSQATVAGHVLLPFTSSGGVFSSVYALPSGGGTGSSSNTLAGPLLFAGQSIVRASSGGIIVGSFTVVPGSSLIISGHTVSAGSSTAFIDGSANALPSSVGEVLHQSSNVQVTAAPNGDGILSAGGSPVTLSGTVYSKLSDGGIVASTPGVNLPTTSRAVVQIAGTSFTALPTGFAINGQSVAEGGSAVTVDGTVVSLGPSGLQIGSSTVPWTAEEASQSVFQVGGTAFTAASTGLMLAGHTLAEGGSAVTVDGTVISLGPSGLQIGSSTIPLNAEQTAEAPLSTFEIDGTSFTAAPTGFPLAGQTVADGGPAVTIDGTIVSLGPSGLRIGSSTIALTAGQTPQPSMGGLIMSGFGSVPSATAGASSSPSGLGNNSSDMPFTGGSNMKLTTDIRTISTCFVGLGIGITAYVL